MGLKQCEYCAWSLNLCTCEGSNMEYAVIYDHYQDVPHRGPMTKQDAEEWIREAEEAGCRPDAFSVARRVVSPWEKV